MLRDPSRSPGPSPKRLSVFPHRAANSLWRHFRTPSNASSTSLNSDSSRNGVDFQQSPQLTPNGENPATQPVADSFYTDSSLATSLPATPSEFELRLPTFHVQGTEEQRTARTVHQPAKSLVRILPEDVLLLVLSLLDPPDLLVCQLVCADLFRCIDHDPGIKYRMELAVNGMVDVPTGSLPPHERLQLLQEYVQRTQGAAEAIAHEARSVGSSTQVLVSGDAVLYSTSWKGRTEIDVLSPPPAGSSDGVAHLHLTLPYTAHVEAIDLSQDLIVISKMTSGVLGRNLERGLKPRLLSVKNGRRHPEAFKPAVDYPDNISWKFENVQIRGRFVAWATRMSDNGLAVEVRSWKTGEVIWHQQFSEAYHVKVSYILFDDAHLMVTTSTNGDELFIYRYAPLPEGHPPRDTTIPVLIMQAPPGTSFGALHRNGRRDHIPNAPFQPDPSMDILGVRFSRKDVDQGTFLIPHHAIYACLARAARDPEPGFRVDWRDWGEFDALALNTTGVVFDAGAPPVPYGTRFPVLVAERGIELCGRVVVFDLNPTLALAAARGVAHRAGERVPVPLATLAGFLCAAPLQSRAPFMAVRGPRLFFRNQHRLVDCGGPMLMTP